MSSMICGVALCSGGLDSILAIKLILDQGIRVYALSCTTPFLGKHEVDMVPLLLSRSDIELVTCDITHTFLKILAHPRHGYGKHLNPCIDCRILMLSEARAFMEKVKADFVFTGEVLGQRPMSQRKDTLRLVERESGLEGILLRPLSAKLLPPTRMELGGLIDREKLLDLQGRSRKIQIQMAKTFHWNDFPTPSGGCLLTDESFVSKVRPLLKKGLLDAQIIQWLKIGRLFTLPDGTKVIVGRNHKENMMLLNMAGKDEIVIKTVTVPGPVAIVLGSPSDEATRLAASIVAGYSNRRKNTEVTVMVGRADDLHQWISVPSLSRDEIEGYRI